MDSAYLKKLRFVDDPISAELIPDECRDEYGVDALKLVRFLVRRWTEREKEHAVVQDVLGLMLVKLMPQCPQECPDYACCGHDEKECVERLVDRIHANVLKEGLDMYFVQEGDDAEGKHSA